MVVVLGEPDRPVLSSDGMKIDGNALSVPVAQLVRGSSPLLHYTVRYREVRLRLQFWMGSSDYYCVQGLSLFKLL